VSEDPDLSPSTSLLQTGTRSFRQTNALLSDENKINPGKPVLSSETNKISVVRVKVSRRAFIRDMQGTYDRS
jgi:hypothetical protein